MLSIFRVLVAAFLLLNLLAGCTTVDEALYSSRELGFISALETPDAARVAEFMQYTIAHADSYTDDTGVLYTPKLRLRPLRVHYMFFYPPGSSCELYALITQYQLPNTVAVRACEQFDALDKSQSRLLVVYRPSDMDAEVSAAELADIIVRQMAFARIEVEFKASLVPVQNQYRLRTVFSYNERFSIGP